MLPDLSIITTRSAFASFAFAVDVTHGAFVPVGSRLPRPLPPSFPPVAVDPPEPDDPPDPLDAPDPLPPP
jgi:hypothetical protein